MALKKWVETKKIICLENLNHRIKIAEDKVEHYKDEGDVEGLIYIIQKGMRQTVHFTDGKSWEKSWKEFLKELVGQKTLDDYGVNTEELKDENNKTGNNE